MTKPRFLKNKEMKSAGGIVHVKRHFGRLASNLWLFSDGTVCCSWISVLLSHWRAVSLSSSCLLHRHFLAQQASVFSHPDSQQLAAGPAAIFLFLFCFFYKPTPAVQVLQAAAVELQGVGFLHSGIRVTIGFVGESLVWTRNQIQTADDSKGLILVPPE